jgi:hypothetical protein
MHETTELRGYGDLKSSSPAKPDWQWRCDLKGAGMFVLPWLFTSAVSEARPNQWLALDCGCGKLKA